MLNTVLLAVIAILLVFCVTILLKIRDNAKNISVDYEKDINNVLKQQNKEMASFYAEEQRLLNQIESLVEEDQLDLSEFTDSTSKRALALAITKAADAVALAESDLEAVRTQLSKSQQSMAEHTEGELGSLALRDKEIYSNLKRQEQVAEERLDNALCYLEKLKTKIQN